jgi:hypothetical protein
MTGRASPRANLNLWWLAFIFLSLVFSVHFFLVQVANMPVSPLQLALNKPLHYWVHPYFSQKWSFFAPTPPDQDQLLVARARLVANNGSLMATPWVDVTSPFYEAVARNRVTPFFLVEIGLSNALSSFTNAMITTPAASFEKNGQRYIKPQLPAGLDPFDATYLTRHASAALASIYPGVSFKDIQIGILTRYYPRFTQRFDPNATIPSSTLIEVDWQPAPQVAPLRSFPILNGFGITRLPDVHP